MTDFASWALMSTAIASDALDRMGRRDRVLDHTIRPIRDDGRLMVGRARTLLFEPGTSDDRDQMLSDYITFIDSIGVDDVAIIACGPGGPYGVWGDVLSTACVKRGAAGVVTDGFSRDILGIRSIGLTLFCGGIGPDDVGGRGRIVGMDIPALCGGVEIVPGDIMIGDYDGCVAVPASLADEVRQYGADALVKDEETLNEVRSGKLLGEVFKITGVF